MGLKRINVEIIRLTREKVNSMFVRLLFLVAVCYVIVDCSSNEDYAKNGRTEYSERPQLTRRIYLRLIGTLSLQIR